MDESEQDNKEKETNWQYNSNENQQNLAGGELSQKQPADTPNVQNVEWSASEYVQHEKDMRWYLALGGVAIVVTVATFLITRQDILATITVFIAFVAIIVYAGRKPQTRQYAVGESGVKVGDKTYKYAEFRSFSVVEEGAIDSIWLKPLKRFAPAVVIYFSPEDEEKIIDTLSVYLPHEDRELDAIDRFSKKVRF